jgi:ATP-binding cassette subfamily B protein
MNYKLKRFLSYYKPYKKQLFLDLLFSAISSFVYISIPMICGYITDKLFLLEKHEALGRLGWFAFIIGILFFVQFFCKRYVEYRGVLYATRMEIDIENQLFEHLHKQDFDFYSKKETGELVSLFTADAFRLRDLFRRLPEFGLDITLIFLFSFYNLFSINKTFASILLFVISLIFLFMFIIFPKIYKVNESSRGLFAKIIGKLEEYISGIKTTQLFTNEKNAVKEHIERNHLYFDTVDKISNKSSILDAGLLSFVIGLIPISTIIGMFFVINGNISMSNLVSIMLYTDILIGPIFNLVFVNNILRESIVGFSRICKIFDVNPKIIDSKDCIELENVKGNIEFNNISFKYDDKYIFKNFNLKIKEGEYLALVGKSGVGKSTLCHLIPRLYDVSKGEVLIDGINIRKIKLKNLRENIGFVQQETFLFSKSILENIKLGKSSATKEEVIEAAKNAYAHDFIMNLPDGYDTEVGQNGTKLSGGQRQRIAIARAFLKNPPILIFDEATSNLDNESERFIQKSMEVLAKNRTFIVIAHRLSTVKNADRIIVLDESRIAEEGSHSDLLNKSGIYSSLYNL